MVDRVHGISEAISEKPEWTFDDKYDAKVVLSNVNEDYLKAAVKVDPKIFRRKYPEVFKTPMKEFRLSIMTGAVKRILGASDLEVEEEE